MLQALKQGRRCVLFYNVLTEVYYVKLKKESTEAWLVLDKNLRVVPSACVQQSLQPNNFLSLSQGCKLVNNNSWVIHGLGRWHIGGAAQSRHLSFQIVKCDLRDDPVPLKYISYSFCFPAQSQQLFLLRNKVSDERLHLGSAELCSALWMCRLRNIMNIIAKMEYSPSEKYECKKLTQMTTSTYVKLPWVNLLVF